VAPRDANIKRVATYWIVGLALLSSGLALRLAPISSGPGVHTLYETAATLLAFLVGVLALVNHYSKRDTTFLIIGAAFIGTAALDGYHTVVTSVVASTLLPSEPSALLPWSWIASRTLLAGMIVLSWYLSRRGEVQGTVIPVTENRVYLLTGAATLAAFLFFAFAPLPQAYFPGHLISRPQELVPALLFLLALVGYLKKRRWRSDDLEHWLVLSLIVNVVGQGVFMSASTQLFDAEFDAAHILKIISYVCVLIGLLYRTSSIYREASDMTFTLAEANISLKLEAAERQRAEAELRANEKRFRDLTEVASDWFWETDADLRFSYLSPKVESAIGLTPEWFYGRTREDTLGPDYDRELWDPLLQMQRERVAFRDFVHPRELPDGSVKWLRVAGMPVYSDDGKFLGYRGVASDITRQRQAREELRLAKDVAVQANSAKTDFLSSMSHELRTPLNSILGFSQLLSTDPVTVLTGDQQDSVEQISNAGQHLLELINEILDLSKIETGAMTLSIENVEIGEAFDSVISLTENLAAARNININADYESYRDLTLRADLTRLRQVLLNLLSNAVKYNVENGTIHVSCQPVADTMMRISVRDSGKGLSADQLTQVFDPFTRLGAERTDIEGTGIGLTITKRLVEMMGGDMGVESTQGTGSNFWFELPRGEVNAAAVVENDVALRDIAPKAATGGTQRRVLYIEDNPANLRLMERILERRADLELLAAHNAEFGIELARTEAPDIVLMDINLPGMSGLEALEKLRAQPGTHSIPVIAVTANATSRDIEHGKAAGFVSYLTKPLVITEVLDAIDATLDIEG